MKIKKKFIIGIVIAICAVAGVTIWAVGAATSKTSAENGTEVSNKKDKMDHNMPSQSSHKENSQQKNNSQDENKSSAESKSQSKIQGQSSATQEAASQLRKDAENASNGANEENSKAQTFTGYITSEDDFAAGLKEDTADMVHMRLMALSGLGITFQQDGKWVFYYFDGTFSTDNKKGADGKWSFDGTGSQLTAWQLVEQSVKSGKGKSPVQVTVTGIVDGSTRTNPGPDADGREFPSIKVESMK